MPHLYYTNLYSYQAMCRDTLTSLGYADLEQMVGEVAEALGEKGGRNLPGNAQVHVFGMCPKCNDVHSGLVLFPLGLSDSPDKVRFAMRKIGAQFLGDGLAVFAAFYSVRDDDLHQVELWAQTIDGRQEARLIFLPVNAFGTPQVMAHAVALHTDPYAAPVALSYFFRGVHDSYRTRESGKHLRRGQDKPFWPGPVRRYDPADWVN